MAPAQQWPRMGFHEAMALTPLAQAHPGAAKRYVSRQPAWTPGGELPWDGLLQGLEGARPRRGAYGGHVYAQAALAAARTVQDEEHEQNGEPRATLGIHSIQGAFTSPGLKDRPFVYDVTPVASGRSFSARLVNVRQPQQPAGSPGGPFAASDADQPLGGICFSCITTFKRAAPTPDEVQELRSAQQRYADVLAARAPGEWPVSPQTDVDLVRDLFPDAGPGAFPILDLRKVDMTAHNAGRPVTERRELVWYRLLEPLPRDDVNAHIVCHAFEADRNGLLMLGNHLGYGYKMGKAATLSYSFYVHVNPAEAVMDPDGWWLQEVSWTRVSAGRCMMESKIWSPQGRHVASGYQDGIIQPDQGAKL